MRAFDDFKRFYADGNNMVRKLIIVNIAVFLLANMVGLALLLMEGWDGYHRLFGIFTGFFSVPADLPTLTLRFWTVVTYSFFHIGFVHLLGNMLFLYWLGNIFREYLGNTKTLSTYFWGGVFGAALYILAYNTIPFLKNAGIENMQLHGASAGVLAIVVAIGTFLPYYEVAFFSFFIPLRWIAVGVVILSFISIPQGNIGGQIAHLGGALYGFIYARHLRRSTVFGSSIENLGDFVGRLFKRKSKLTVVKKETTVYSTTSVADFDDEYEPNQEEIDAILDKISQSGYESLSRKERELLYKASKQD